VLKITTSIVALHGLGGTWDSSWTKATGGSWLLDVLPSKYPSSRILSYQCPDLLHHLKADDINVSSLLDELVYTRREAGRIQIPIIFVGHSLGGSILKQIYVVTHPTRETRSDLRELNQSICGYLFLGTPQKSIVYQDIGSLCRAFERESERSLGGNVDDLEEALNVVVTRINEDFRRLLGEELPACCFYETRKTWIGVKEVRVSQLANV
jgi:hypothetical protein